MKNQLTPPYLPFSSFLTALDRLGQAVPTQITRDVFASASGVLKGQILIALRFFDLIDENGFPKGDLLERLAKEKSTSRRQANLRDVILSSYKEVTKFDLAKMSPTQLDTAFQRYQVNGDTKIKAKTFFIKAAQFAELDLSPLLTSNTRTPSGKKQSALKSMEGQAPSEPNGIRRIFEKEFQFSDGTMVTLAATGDLTETDDDTLFALSAAAKLLKARSSPPTEAPSEPTEVTPASN